MPKEDNDKAAKGLFPIKQKCCQEDSSKTNPCTEVWINDGRLDNEVRARREFKFSICKEGAVVPNRAHYLDSGYDLTIIDVVKNYGKTKLYGTGIKIQPPEGIYFDMVARSSISKTGYILTNSIGIIDNQYRGELLVALTKIDDSKPDLELPIRIAQLIPRQWIDLQPAEITKEELTYEERGEAGWGSTGT